jgi:DNA-binding response OmpR family regulator
MKAVRKRVLIADCHDEVLITLEKLLEDAGFDTTTVWTGKDVLKFMQSEHFDLLLVNEYLPDAECEELLHALEKDQDQVPFIVMLPSAPEINDLKAFEMLGAAAVVNKYSYSRILEEVTECLCRDHAKKRIAA